MFLQVHSPNHHHQGHSLEIPIPTRHQDTYQVRICILTRFPGDRARHMHFSWRNPNLFHLSKAHIWTLSSHPPRDAITAAPTGSAQHRTQILPQTFSSSVYLFPRLNLPWPRTIPKPRRPHALNTSCAGAPSLSSLSLPIPQTPHLGLLTVLTMSQSALP